MDKLKLIGKLVLKAKNESIPEIDVTDQVLRRIQAEQLAGPVVMRISPMSIFAGISAVAASIIIFFAINAWLSLSDPLMQFFGPVQVASVW